MTRSFLAMVVCLCLLTPLVHGDKDPSSELVRGESPRPIVFAPQAVAAGELLRIVAVGRIPSGETITVMNGAGATIASAVAVQSTRAGIPVSHFFVGIDSTTEPGAHSLVLMGRVCCELAIREGAYRNVEIPLSSGLTTLRRDYDPRKLAESRELSELVLSRDPDAVYHSGALDWPMPADTRQSALFGDRRTYLYSDGQRARTIHVGLDLAAPTGTPILSSGAGIVRLAKERIVTGNTVVIEHLPGLFSLYYHLDEIEVSVDQTVETGDRLGTVGATGLATGPHLHWEIRVGGVPVAPDRATEQPLVETSISLP